MINEAIVNRVANTNLITIDLENYRDPHERVLLDIKDQLYKDLVLKEKDFRDFIKRTDWSFYTKKNVAVICSSDAIIPNWAYMLIASAMHPYANVLVFGDLQVLEERLYHQAINDIDIEPLRNAKVVIKGCSNLFVPVAAYIEITKKLTPFVSSLMYGEPCSTVPVYKARKS